MTFSHLCYWSNYYSKLKLILHFFQEKLHGSLYICEISLKNSTCRIDDVGFEMKVWKFETILSYDFQGISP